MMQALFKRVQRASPDIAEYDTQSNRVNRTLFAAFGEALRHRKD